MKKIFSSIIAVVITACASVVCFAQHTTIHFNYSASQEEMVVFGKSDKKLSIVLTPYGKDTSESPDNAAYFKVLSPNKNNVFSTNIFKLSERFESGKYTIYVTDSIGNSSASDFMYVKTPLPDDIVSKINTADTKEKLKAEFEANSAALGIDMNDVSYKSHCAKAYSIFNCMNNTYTVATSGEIIDDFRICLFLSQLKDSTMDQSKKLIKDNLTILGFEYDGGLGDYDELLRDSRLNEDDYPLLYELLAESDYERIISASPQTFSFAEYYRQMMAVTKVKNCRNWQELKEVMTDKFKSDFAFVGENVEYKKLKNTDTVFQYMIKSDFDNMAQIKSVFESSVSKTKEEDNTSYSPSKKPSSLGGSTLVLPSQPSTPIPSQPVAPSFVDVAHNHWCAVPISELCKLNIINGFDDGTFKPDNNVTRAEFVKLIITALKLTLSDGTQPFNDVQNGSWYEKHVIAGVENGIIHGNPDGSFCPDNQITKQDAACMLYRAINPKTNLPTQKELFFNDTSQISPYSREAVAALYSAQIITGDQNNNFNPQGLCKRSEAAKMIYEMLLELS